MTSKKKKKYFPNNWKAYSEVPSEAFESLPFDVFMEWKIGGYELPASHVAMLRVRNVDTGKVKETETKESPVIPEVKEEKKEPTLAEEANITDVTADPIYGPPAPKQGLDITSEQLEDWKSTSGYFDETSDKTALTQMANWQKAGKPKRDIATIGPSRTGGGLPVMNW